jgi:antitoxin VapB
VALNIRDKETEALVAQITSLTGETTAEAVRMAARERLDRLRLLSGEPHPRRDAESMRRFLDELRSEIPEALRGKSITKAEREEILGYGPDGY